MFTGLSAFPLTPFSSDTVDEVAFAAAIDRLAVAGVDSIAVLGSTGCGPYLRAAERDRVVRLAVDHAEGTPVFVGVSALRTSSVIAHAEAAVKAGADALVVAPQSYQPLTADDVFELYRALTSATSLPVVVYDNPATTHFVFTEDLYGRVAALPGIASLKIPGRPEPVDEVRARVSRIRALVPPHVTVGISGDPFAAAGLIGGCDAWYSAVGGTLPDLALNIVRLAAESDLVGADRESDRLEPLWRLFREHGSLRVTAAIAELLGFAGPHCLPRPLLGLPEERRRQVGEAATELGLG